MVVVRLSADKVGPCANTVAGGVNLAEHRKSTPLVWKIHTYKSMQRKMSAILDADGKENVTPKRHTYSTESG
jgi:hypothetical protein